MPSIPLPQSARGEYALAQQGIPSPGSPHTTAPITLPLNAQSPELYASISDSQPSSIAAPSGTLPPQLLSLFSSIQSTLQTAFSTAPPHTIQRLAELILRPSDHYRTLPSYLRAVDRVLSVSSTADIYPLQAATSGSAENGDGATNSFLTSVAPTINRDDFNGAALTRIPWLRDTSSILSGTDRPSTSDLRTESTSLIDGPNGAGSLETVTVSINGIPTMTRENNGSTFTPETAMGSAEPVLSSRVTRSSSALARREEEADEERVHARGPDEIGMEDMGPQATNREPGGFDVEAALGRKGEGANIMVARREEEEKGEKDADGDAIIEDSDDKKGGK